jgi:hypothetical protein
METRNKINRTNWKRNSALFKRRYDKEQRLNTIRIKDLLSINDIGESRTDK